MAMLNLKTCDFVVYSSSQDDIKIVEVNFDAEYATEMVSKLKKIYFSKMLHEICGHK